MSKKNTLTIISLPFYRLERILLMNSFLHLFQTNSDLLIISEYKNNEELKIPNCEVLNIIDSRKNSILYTILDYLRVYGFFYKNRNKGLAYYNKEKLWEYKINGNDQKKSKLNSFLILFTSIIGSNNFFLSLFKFFFGRILFSDINFLKKVKGYDNINVIQSANWDFQDNKLGWLTSKIKCKTFFLPYTTDQLMCNGFLVTNFDYILIQGPKELFYAQTLHQVESRKIIKFGNILFRNISTILDGQEKALINKKKKKILYIGVSSLYYPFSSQILIIDRLLSTISNLSNFVLVLRPLLTEEEKVIFEKRYAFINNVEIKYPEHSNYLMKPKDYSQTVSNEFTKHILNLMEVDICFFAGITSMILEASYLKKKIVSIFYDPTGVLRRRNMSLFFKSDKQLSDFNEFSCLQILNNLDEIPLILNNLILLTDADYDISKKIVHDWDYPNVNQSEIIDNLFFKTK